MRDGFRDIARSSGRGDWEAAHDTVMTRPHITLARNGAYVKRENFVPYSGNAEHPSLRVLHIVPFNYFDPEYFYLGSCKDHDGRQQYLRQANLPFDTFAHLKNRQTFEDEFSFFNLPDYSHIVVDLSVEASELAYLRRRWPKARLIVRSHNPEIMHRFDYIHAARRFGTRKERRLAHANIGVFFARERAVARFAHTILHIETPNTIRYWRALGFTGQVLVAPYYLTNAYLSKIPPGGSRRKQILCVGSSHPGPFIFDMLTNFHRAVAELGEGLSDLEFLCTGALPDEVSSISAVTARVKHVGFVDDIMALQAESFATVVPSDLGRGFKTKILDAVLCGAWVIVTPGLMRRMPAPLKPYCAVLSMEDPARSLEKAVAELEAREWPAGDPNAALRSAAYRALDKALAG